jgi:hypothetical protein
MGQMDELFENLEKFLKPLKTSASIFDQISGAVTETNKAFGESRTRVTEFSTSIADSVMEITRLGGTAADAGNVIAQVAEGSRRNMIATTETITELYATSEFLGKTVSQLTDAFSKAGMEASLIAERTVDSVSYVQSLGLNAKEIMGDVVDNMDMMNQFNFQNGVMGLTKMAAQASMLRFDMNKTAEFADSVMDPEGAIKMASTFQRLGATMGTLVDPFALMDASINDPGKLQDSIINMAKTYAQFNEETQRFEINPYGLRMLKEIGQETGLGAENLKKAAIAALDLDTRLADINFSIDASDEDKTLVANLAKRDEGGEYIVKVSDEEGYKKLSELSQGQFEKLVKQQEDTPKTMEEIASRQLSFSELIENNTKATADGLAAALVGQTAVFRNFEGVRRVGEDVYDAGFSAMGSSQDIRKMFEGVGDDIRSLVYEAAQNRDAKSIDSALSAIEKAYEGTKDKSAEMMRTFLANLGDNKPKSEIETMYNKTVNMIKDTVGIKEKNINIEQNVSMNGTVKFQVDTPSGISRKELEDIMNSTEFKNKIYQQIIESGNRAIVKEK